MSDYGQISTSLIFLSSGRYIRPHDHPHHPLYLQVHALHGNHLTHISVHTVIPWFVQTVQSDFSIRGELNHLYTA